MKENKKKLILSITGVTLLLIAIVGATFAYFSASATNNTTVVGNTSEASNLELTITKMDSATGGLIPMNDNLAGTGITNNCVDSNGNTVCHVYDIELKNGKSKVMISGNVNFTSYSNSNIVYNIIFSDIADGASSEKDLSALGTEVGETTTGTTYSTPGTLTSKTSFDANEIKHYYLVVWLHDTSAAQQDTDGGKENGYTGTVSFNAVDGAGNNSGVTAVFSTSQSQSTEYTPVYFEWGTPTTSSTSDYTSITVPNCSYGRYAIGMDTNNVKSACYYNSTGENLYCIEQGWYSKNNCSTAADHCESKLAEFLDITEYIPTVNNCSDNVSTNGYIYCLKDDNYLIYVYTNGDVKMSIVDGSINVANDGTVTTDPSSYTLTVNANDCGTINTTTGWIVNGTSATKKYYVSSVNGGTIGTLPEFTVKSGYNFEGWYDSNDMIYDDYEYYSGDLTLYAHCSAN